MPDSMTLAAPSQETVVHQKRPGGVGALAASAVGQPCPYCTGSGMVKSIPTICYKIQTEARKMSADLDAQSLTLRVNPEIAKTLKTLESSLIEDLEQKWTHSRTRISSPRHDALMGAWQDFAAVKLRDVPHDWVSIRSRGCGQSRDLASFADRAESYYPASRQRHGGGNTSGRSPRGWD